MTRWLLAFAFALLLSFNGWGCASPPPRHYSVDSELTPEQSMVIDDAIAAWCDAVGYCPERVLWSERGRYVVAHDYWDHDRPEDSSAHNDGDNIYLDASGHGMNSGLDVFWLMVAHEWGHFCIDGHPVPNPSLMHWHVDPRFTPLEIDAASASAWRKSC